MKQLLPEIGLLDPVERLERLQPLERQAADFQTKVRTIKTDFNDQCFQNNFNHLNTQLEERFNVLLDTFRLKV